MIFVRLITLVVLFLMVRPGLARVILRPEFDHIHNLIIYHSSRVGLDSLLIAAVIKQEGCYRGCRSHYGWNRGPSGEFGVMQVMGYHEKNPQKLFNPTYNIKVGTDYLARMIRLKRSIYRGVSAYNTGPNTRRINHRYVRNVLHYWAQFRQYSKLANNEQYYLTKRPRK